MKHDHDSHESKSADVMSRPAVMIQLMRSAIPKGCSLLFFFPIQSHPISSNFLGDSKRDLEEKTHKKKSFSWDRMMQMMVDQLTRSATPRPKPRAKSRQSLHPDKEVNHHPEPADGRRSAAPNIGTPLVKVQTDPYTPPVYRYKSERTWKTMWGAMDPQTKSQVLETRLEREIEKREIPKNPTARPVPEKVLHNYEYEKNPRLLDPRRTSRSSSARKDLYNRGMRYEDPVTASPSRNMDRAKPWEEYFEEPNPFVGSRGKSSFINPPANGQSYFVAFTELMNQNVGTPNVNHAQRSTLALKCFSPSYTTRSPSPFSKSSKTQSELGGFSSGKSDSE